MITIQMKLHKFINYTKNFFVTCLVCLLGIIFGSNKSCAESSLLKNGFYKALGIGTGYYYYGEVDRQDKHIMHLDMMLFNVYGNLGYVANSGFRTDFALDANVALGQYTGGVLDTSDATKNGERLVRFMQSSFYHGELKVGYNLLKPFLVENASLYLQGGVGYYFNRTDLVAMHRLQGYLYIPIHLEGELALSEKWALNYMGGLNAFILGNHFSSKGHDSKDLDVLQHDGFGARAFIGATYKTKSDRINSFRLVYEYWSLEGSPAVDMTDYAGNQTALYEPKNSSHILTIQYIWNF